MFDVFCRPMDSSIQNLFARASIIFLRYLTACLLMVPKQEIDN